MRGSTGLSLCGTPATLVAFHTRHLARHGHLTLAEAIERQLQQVSVSTVRRRIVGLVRQQPTHLVEENNSSHIHAYAGYQRLDSVADEPLRSGILSVIIVSAKDEITLEFLGT